MYLRRKKRRGRACEPGEIGIREAVGVHRQHGVSSDGFALEPLCLVLPPGGALKHALDLHRLSRRSLPIRSDGYASDARKCTDLLVVTVLLFKDVLHFLLHTLNAKPDAVDSRRHAVHLAIEAPKVVQNLVVLLDGLELHGLCRTFLVPYRKCKSADGRKGSEPAGRLASGRRACAAFRRPRCSPSQTRLPRRSADSVWSADSMHREP